MKKSNLKLLEDHGVPIFGDLDFRGECLEEAAEQMIFFQLLKNHHPDLFEISFHAKNEGKKPKFVGALERQAGVRAGVPDVVIACCPPILIELKRRAHNLSEISGKQIKFLSVARSKGAFSCVALGATAAIEAVDQALKMQGCCS